MPPAHILNAPTRSPAVEKQLGYGAGIVEARDHGAPRMPFPARTTFRMTWIASRFYQPKGSRVSSAEIGRRLEYWAELRAKR